MALLTVFLVAVFFFSLTSRLVDRSRLTPPILFTAVGVVSAAVMSELFGDGAEAGPFLLIAEVGLVLLLFADASHCDLSSLSSIRRLPTRLLSVGMLLTIGLGLLAALVLFDHLSVWEAGILAAVLAPTDAGLGQVIVTDERIPRPIREALNVEAGLNDGLAVPFLLFFIAMAAPSGDHEASLARFVVDQLGYGVVIGFAVGRGGGWLAKCAQEMGWIGGRFANLAFLAMPLICLQLAHALDGSAFIAAFVAGLALPRTSAHATEIGVEFVEDWGQLINFAVFFLFGMLVVSNWSDLRPVHFFYGLLSLTVIRMLPVAVGAGRNWAESRDSGIHRVVRTARIGFDRPWTRVFGAFVWHHGTHDRALCHRNGPDVDPRPWPDGQVRRRALRPHDNAARRRSAGTGTVNCARQLT